MLKPMRSSGSTFIRCATSAVVKASLRFAVPDIIHLTTKGIGEPDQLPTNQRHKADDAEQHKKTEQEHTPDSGYILGQQMNSGADCTNRQQQKRSQKNAGFVDGEFSHIHFDAPPIHI